MQTPPLLVLLSCVTFSLAILVTTPKEGDTWTSSGPNTMTWSRVSTDPDNCAIILSQQGVNKQTLADSVSTSQGSFIITSTLPVGSSFRVNLVKSAQELDAILAQSAQFNITQGNGSSKTASSVLGTASVDRSLPSATSSALSGTEIPNASNGALTPTKSSSANSLEYQEGLMGIFALLGLAITI